MMHLILVLLQGPSNPAEQRVRSERHLSAMAQIKRDITVVKERVESKESKSKKAVRMGREVAGALVSVRGKVQAR